MGLKPTTPGRAAELPGQLSVYLLIHQKKSLVGVNINNMQLVYSIHHGKVSVPFAFPQKTVIKTVTKR